MGGARADRGRRRVVPALIAALVAVLVVGLGAAGAVAYQDGRLNGLICDGDCGPSAVTPPDGLAAVPVTEPAVEPAVSGAPDLAAALAAAQGEADDPLLGPHVGVAMASVEPDGPISTTSDDAFVPASTTKLLTGLSALVSLEPQQRFTTSVTRSGDRLVLVGGGDPYLTVRKPRRPDVRRATLTDLADRTAAALKADGVASVSLGYDETLFTGDADNPAWERSYVRDGIVTPITALWVDRGIDGGVHSRTPAADAAARFAGLLQDRGIEVAGDAVPTASSGAPIAAVESATVAQIVETMVRTSDNEAAEVVARHVARAAGQPPTFAGGSAAIVAVLEEAGVDVGTTRLFDASGLARGNRITPATLVDVVRTALTSGRTAPVVDDLPVSGFSGTLSDRFDRSARGLVRAKTGTLSGVHSLAGVATDAAGRPIVFAVMTDDADTAAPFAAQAAVDDVVEALAGTGG